MSNFDSVTKNNNNLVHDDDNNNACFIKDDDINPYRLRYTLMDLIKEQPLYLSINWSDYKDIPHAVRFASHSVDNDKFMKNMIAMFKRQTLNPWLAGKEATEKKEKLTKKLTGVLNKMTPSTFNNIAKVTMDIVNEFAATEEVMNIITGLILQFGIKQPIFFSQYAKLCQYLYDQWILSDPAISNTFRTKLIQQINDLFNEHKHHSSMDIPHEDEKQIASDIRAKKRDNFFAVMVLVAELFNVELIKKNLVYKGVFDMLLPPNNNKLSEIDIEGLCHLFKRCGQKLEEYGKKEVDRYLQKLQSHARKYDFRTKVLVDVIVEMKKNGWKQPQQFQVHEMVIYDGQEAEIMNVINQNQIVITYPTSLYVTARRRINVKAKQLEKKGNGYNENQKLIGTVLDEIHYENKVLKNELDEIKTNEIRLSKQNGLLMAKNIKLEEGINDLNEENKVLKDGFNKIKTNETNLNEENVKLRNENEKLKEKNVSLEQHNNDLNEEVKEMQCKLNELQNELQYLLNTLDA